MFEDLTLDTRVSWKTLIKRRLEERCALLNQQELVLPEPGMQFGIDGTIYPHKIRHRLEELPSVVLVDDDCSPLSDSYSSCSS